MLDPVGTLCPYTVTLRSISAHFRPFNLQYNTKPPASIALKQGNIIALEPVLTAIA